MSWEDALAAGVPDTVRRLRDIPDGADCWHIGMTDSAGLESAWDFVVTHGPKPVPDWVCMKTLAVGAVFYFGSD